MFEHDNVKNEAFLPILRVFFIFQKVDDVKNDAILRAFLQKWKVQCRGDGLVPMRFAIFQPTCLKYCACHEKVMPGDTKRCTCQAK